MAFYSSVLLTPDGNLSPDGTLACMYYVYEISQKFNNWIQRYGQKTSKMTQK